MWIILYLALSAVPIPVAVSALPIPDCVRHTDCGAFVECLVGYCSDNRCSLRSRCG